MNTYYYETHLTHGKFNASSDAYAAEMAKQNTSILICYRESDTPDGLPFITIYEKQKRLF